MLDDPLEVARQLGVKVDVGQFERLGSRLASLRADIARPQDDRLATILTRVIVRSGHIELTLASAALSELLGLGSAGASSTIALQASGSLSGRRIKLVNQQMDSAAPGAPASTVKMLVRARSWWAELTCGELDIASLSRREGVSDSYITRTVRLAFLAPEIVEEVLAGKLPGQLDGKALAAMVAGHAGWEEQRAAMSSLS